MKMVFGGPDDSGRARSRPLLVVHRHPRGSLPLMRRDRHFSSVFCLHTNTRGCDEMMSSRERQSGLKQRKSRLTYHSFIVLTTAPPYTLASPNNHTNVKKNMVSSLIPSTNMLTTKYHASISASQLLAC